MIIRTTRTARHCSGCSLVLALLGLLYSTRYYSPEQFPPLTIPQERTTPLSMGVWVAIDNRRSFHFERFQGSI